MDSAIVITSDHAGYELKTELTKYLTDKGIEVVDFGTNSSDSVDYPDFGHELGKSVGEGKFNRGISICGSGNGINMVSNKHKGVRAAICWNVEISEMARKHNNANVCSLPARYINIKLAKEIVDAFLSTEFEGGRHQQRINKIDL